MTVVTNARVFYHHARLRAHRAPGIPCALCILGLNFLYNSGASRCESVRLCPAVIACGKAHTPIRLMALILRTACRY